MYNLAKMEQCNIKVIDYIIYYLTMHLYYVLLLLPVLSYFRDLLPLLLAYCEIAAMLPIIITISIILVITLLLLHPRYRTTIGPIQPCLLGSDQYTNMLAGLIRASTVTTQHLGFGCI